MPVKHVTCLLMLMVAIATISSAENPEEEVAPPNMNLQQAQAMFRQTFQELDLNHDHQVDFKEFVAPYMRHDHDLNMVVTLPEFLQQAPEEENQEMLSADFRFHDVNHDGSITIPEMKNQFDNIDADENQEITEAEFLAFGTRLFTEKSHPSFEQPAVGK